MDLAWKQLLSNHIQWHLHKSNKGTNKIWSSYTGYIAMEIIGLLSAHLQYMEVCNVYRYSLYVLLYAKLQSTLTPQSDIIFLFMHSLISRITSTLSSSPSTHICCIYNNLVLYFLYIKIAKDSKMIHVSYASQQNTCSWIKLYLPALCPV